ncbi:MAG: LLM class F420-dependent oxidoreductase [Chloroflexi bacterium]|nr:LLM class F420-dependent oxidoreductase [Chloroflexota bacterium]
MKIGVVFPQTEFGSDPEAIKDYAQTAEELGYNHILAYDHVLGANPERPGGWQGPYTYQHPFHEPFVLYSFMAAVTKRIEFVPGIIILPQRQTVLVAKQAAALDVLSGGRLRLGIGTGWNPVEYTALNQDFHTRGKRQEEQVEVLRRLWTEQLVTYKGRWHTIPDAGLNPLPIQQPIPIWFGGSHPNVLRRIAKMGDGWLINQRNAAEAKPGLEKLDAFLKEVGRSREDIGLESRLMYADGNPDVWAQGMEEWRELGATHIALNTMYAGLDTAAAHIEAIKVFAKTVNFE